MFARKMGSAWEVYAPAKLNLYLEVLGRRDDGFHELETLMAPIRIYDRLQWRPAADSSPLFSLEYDASTPANLRSAAPLDGRNLVWRAFELVAQTAGVTPTGRISLIKRIPTEAGLGGGSSDAAAALVLANAAWGLNYSTCRLAELAARLGSDVAFFLAGQSAVCRGRGERVTPVAGLPRLDVVVVKPPAGVPTAAAFSLIDARPVMPAAQEDSAPLRIILDRLRYGSLAAAGRYMFNRLESVASSICPGIDRLRATFARLPCHAHLMTGSGSAYFGVMRSARHARRASRILSSSNMGIVFTTATCR